ncbi:hypothetical protein K432DRAFT_433628 [Lepidopterella palustris CBS 459.81]|uniref:Mediator of RNA polymerase II transcription subunit 17 n=1 Tax=Lepidopterella palustris CBS 459.81 TaxID=1314670 RepID=A0A8E2JGY9_9PEZI|nr:hypothetical protein K432DRAFT_433628 [Lepidopterella palustris CBS 459.81]
MTDTGAAPAAASLRPWPTEDPSAEDMQLQLRRLYQQRGHFRHITEEGLEEEIKAADYGSGDVMEGVEEDTTPSEPTEKERRAEIMAAKAQMQQFIGTALNETMIALDFISLLLTKDSPHTAETTMSPMLKQSGVPKGSLGFDKWPISEADDEVKRKEELVAKGWRMKGLESAADNILQAATRLETEVRKETKYWEQVLSIAEKGWSVRRITRQGHRPTLGVQFGFSEASDYFKGRGLAPLRMNNDGAIILDAELTQRPKSVRVRVMEDGNITGTSKIASIDNALQPSIEDLIRRARDSLFEEELYHEMALETRTLLSYDVKIRNSVIHFPAPISDDPSSPGRTLLIDIVSIDEVQPETDSHTSDGLAQNVAEVLRVLLSHAHRERLSRRSRIPPPLSENRPQNPSPPILRSLLYYFQSSKAINSIRNYFLRTRKTLMSAGLHVSFKLSFDSTLSSISKIIKESEQSGTENSALLDQLVRLLLTPVQTTATLSLPSSVANPTLQEELNVSLRTSMAAPIYGTEYTLTVPHSSVKSLYSDKDSKRTSSFKSFSELTSFIDLVISIDLTHSLIAGEFKSWQRVDRMPELSKGRVGVDPGLGIKMENGDLTLSGTAPATKTIWNGAGGKKTLREIVRAFTVDG